jgi:hypothetical protein
VKKKDKDRPENERIYRYWVEIRDPRDGSSRTLPLQALQLIHLITERGASPKPDEQILRLQDDSDVIEANDVDELAAKLRSRYPDETDERRLHWERDFEGEQRRATAREALIDLFVEVLVNEIRTETAIAREQSTAARRR